MIKSRSSVCDLRRLATSWEAYTINFLMPACVERRTSYCLIGVWGCSLFSHCETEIEQLGNFRRKSSVAVRVCFCIILSVVYRVPQQSINIRWNVDLLLLRCSRPVVTDETDERTFKFKFNFARGPRAVNLVVRLTNGGVSNRINGPPTVARWTQQQNASGLSRLTEYWQL